MPPSNERSAEWLRGAVHVAVDCEEPVAVAYYTKLLAAAEAREAGELKEVECPECEGHGDANWRDEEAYSTPCDKCGGKSTIPQPTAAEVIEAAEKCLHHERQGLQNLIDFRGFWFGGERRYGALTMEEITDAMKRLEAVSEAIARWKEANGGK